ncbi:MAG: branched-chain amino acid transaminase [Candidatus Dormibacteria bacterium]
MSSGRAQDDYWVFHGGEFKRYGEVGLGLLTHALHYGTGCFDGVRAYWNETTQKLHVFRPTEHFERLRQNARLLHMEVPHTAAELTGITLELLRRNQFATDVYIRPLCYKASEEIGIRFHNLEDGFFIVAVPFGAYMDTTAGIRCQVSSWRRIDDNVAPARSKSSGIYVNSALAKTAAAQDGYDEAILLTHDGHVSEGSAENIFIYRRGRFATPPSSDNILEGITRDTLTQLITAELGLDVQERTVSRSELYVAEEVLLCGTGAEVSAVIEIDRRPIGTGEPGPLTRRLQQLYFSACKGELPRYADWAVPVATRAG